MLTNNKSKVLYVNQISLTYKTLEEEQSRHTRRARSRLLFFSRFREEKRLDFFSSELRVSMRVAMEERLTMRVGRQVEVCYKDDGFGGIWYQTTIMPAAEATPTKPKS